MPTVVPLDLVHDDQDLDRWQNYILNHPDTQYADLGQWRRLFADLYGMRSVNFACVENGRTLGVVSLYLIGSPFFGRLLITCPFFGSGGLYVDDLESERALLESVEAVAKELRVDFIELRLRRPLPEPYAVDSRSFVEFELELGDTTEDVWKHTLSSNTRQNIRKAQKQSLEFSIETEPAATAGLLAETIRDLGTPFHSDRFFELLRKHLPDAIRFSEVRQGQRLIAAGMMVRFRDRLSTPYIGSLKAFRGTRANYCQYWGIIEHSIDNGIRRFDMGRSQRGSTHQQFKEKWGAVGLEAHYAHRVLSRRKHRTVLEPSALERFVSESWKHLPVAVTRRIGHLAARYIP